MSWTTLGTGARAARPHPLPSKGTGTSLGGLRGPGWAALSLGLHLCTGHWEEVHEGPGQGLFFWVLECDLEKAQTRRRPAAGLLPPGIKDAALDLRRTHLSLVVQWRVTLGSLPKTFREMSQ